jgi:hypothetical protein
VLASLRAAGWLHGAWLVGLVRKCLSEEKQGLRMFAFCGHSPVRDHREEKDYPDVRGLAPWGLRLAGGFAGRGLSHLGSGLDLRMVLVL